MASSGTRLLGYLFSWRVSREAVLGISDIAKSSKVHAPLRRSAHRGREAGPEERPEKGGGRLDRLPRSDNLLDDRTPDFWYLNILGFGVNQQMTHINNRRGGMISTTGGAASTITSDNTSGNYLDPPEPPPSDPPTPPVPEPATLALMTLGGLIVLARKRTQR